MKKLISFFLSVVMLVSVVASVDFSAYAYTSGRFEYSVSGSKAEITKYTGSATSVTIPSTIDGYTVTSIGESAFKNCTSLTSVTIPNSVTLIRGCAFEYCTSLTSVTIPNSVTSIYGYAFSECRNLTSVTIGNSVTSIGLGAFRECTSLTSVTIGNSVTSIGDDAFYNCKSLTSVTIPNSVTSIGNSAFRECTSLTSVTIGNSVTSIGDYAFLECTSLTSVTIPDSVTSIGNSAFYFCTSLTSVTIGNSVTSIGNDAFHNCTSLTSVTIPDSVTKIGEYAFRLCTSLTSVTIGNSVTSIGDDAFSECESLTSVTIPNSVTSIGSSAFWLCTSLTSVTIGNSVTSIGRGAFAYCRSLTSIKIPNSVTSIGNDAFYRVNNIVYNGSASGSPWGAKAKNGYVNGYLVYRDNTKRELLGCSASATSVTIPDSVTRIGDYAFYYCTSLTSVTIPNSVTKIGEDAFYKVNNIVYHGSASGYPWGAKNSSGYVEGYLVYRDNTQRELLGCSAQATTVTIPDSVTSIAYEAFYDCKSLTSVTIPNSVTSIGGYAFYNCSKIKYVFYSGSQNEWKNISIGENNSPLTSTSAKIHYNSTGDHSWNSGAVTKQPTCVGTGIKTYTCTVCDDTKEETINATGVHTWDNGTITIQPTCVSTGIKTYSCVNCTATKTETLDATGIHTYSSRITQEATCTANGVRTFTCTVCNDSYTETIAPAHSFTNYVSDDNFTCTEDGTKTAKCDRCDVTNTVTDFGSALDHEYVSVTTNPTCTEDGYITYTCSRCNDRYVETATEEILVNKTDFPYPESPHNYSNSKTYNYSFSYPNATQLKITFSSSTNTESNYDYIYIYDKSGSQIGKYSGTTLADKTITLTGDSFSIKLTTNRSNTYYGFSLSSIYATVELKAGHNYSSQVTQEATCTENGVRTYTCSVCNNSYTETITALGHSFTNYVSDDNFTCTEDGTKTAKCDRCDVTNTVTDFGSALDHEYISVTTNPTCTEDGYITYTCSRCNDRYVETAPQEILVNKTDFPYPESPHNYSNNQTYNYSFSYPNATQLKITFSSSTKTESNYDYIYIYDKSGSQIGKYSGTTLADKTITLTGDSFSITLTTDSSNTYYGFSLSSIYATVELKALGHIESEVQIENRIESTCQEEGSYDEVIYCSRCNEELSRNTKIIDMSHKYSLVSVIEPLCLEDGFNIYQCNFCEQIYTEQIDPLGHEVVIDEAVEPSCTETGLTEGSHCSRCNTVITEQVSVEKLPHDYTSYITNATCTEDAYITYTCSRCNDRYVETATEEILVNKTDFPYPESPHNYGNNQTYNYSFSYPNANQLKITFSSSTKTESSYDYIYIYDKSGSQIGKYSGTTLADKTITLTGDSFSITLTTDSSNTYYGFSLSSIYATVELKAGHNYSSQVTQEATCTENGVRTYTCSACNDSYTETITAPGHSFTNYVSDDNFTCTEDGTKTAKCDRCDVTNTVIDFGSALDHEYISVTTNPTCTEQGYITYTCTHCDESYTEITSEPLGHNVVFDAAVEPTCTTTGLTEGSHCSVCNIILTKQEIIAASGHSYTLTRTSATCTSNGFNIYTCSACKTLKTEAQEALGHEYTETEYIAPTSTSDGKIVYTCIRCSDSYNEVIPATGETHTHTWGEWVYNGDASYTSSSVYTDGTATRTCACGETETKTIAGTGLLRARTATSKFESELKMCIATRTAQVNQFKEVYCVFTREDGVAITIPASKSYVATGTTSNTYFDFGVTPQGLNSPVVIRFYGITNDGITVWGDDYTYVMTTNYILKQLRSPASSDTLKNLFVEMIYYGYENQIYSNWDLEHPLTDLLTEQEKARHTTAPLTLNRYQKTDFVECKNPETTWRSVSLVLGAATKIKYRTQAMTLSDDLKAVVEVEGEAEPYTYYYNDPEDAEYFTEDGAGGIYFTFPDLAVKRLRSKVYVTLYKGDTPIINTFEYSAETYAYGRKQDSAEYPVTQQQMRFADAARAYFGI